MSVVGSNGSGKSTLLRIVSGLLRPSSGKIVLQIDGASVATEHIPLNVGFVAPYLNFYGGLAARENLRFAAKARRMADADTSVAETLHAVDLDREADQFASNYSSGMIQRLRIASAMLHRPSVLILDEPFSNLDEAGRHIVESVVDKFVSTGGTVLLATNDADRAAICSRSLNVENFWPAR